MKFADLHLHTAYSDGTYTPEELIQQAVKFGISVISVVDHDTVDGIEPVVKAALGRSIEVIPGVELTAEYGKSEVHILGYLIDYQDECFKEKMVLLKKNRVDRVYRILDKLMDLGLKLDPQAVFDISADGTAGRLHIARAMVKEGLVGSTGEAFNRYIGDRCPAYVLGFRYFPAEAIKLIKDVGGVPVLAHPYSLQSNDLILEFIKSGIMGLEVYYPEHTKAMIGIYEGYCRKYNLLLTGGSDCHGSAKPEAKIGSIKLPYELVEKLKQAVR
ncbi:MAG: PHP domain-containing protein [Candidatus Omnitrophota bacterium]